MDVNDLEVEIDLSMFSNNYEKMYRRGDGCYVINGLVFSDIGQAARYIIDDSSDVEEYRIAVLLCRIQLLNAQIEEANYWVKILQAYERELDDTKEETLYCFGDLDYFYENDLGGNIQWTTSTAQNGTTRDHPYDTYSESDVVTSTWTLNKKEINILINALDSFASSQTTDIQTMTVSMNSSYDLHDEFKNMSGNIIDRIGKVVENLVSLLR